MREELIMMRSSWPQDVLAGITVAIVALPLALGFGITSGAGAASGVATAIIAGLIAALAGGSRFQVSGPTGAMTVILVPIIASQGISVLFPVSLVAAILLVLLGIVRTGKLMERIPWSVAEGFTLGIALVIALQQIPLIFQVPRVGGTETLVVASETIIHAFQEPINLLSLAFVAATLIVKFVWSFVNRSLGWKYTIPASAVAVVIVTTVAVLTSAPIARIGNLPSSSIFQISIGWTSLSLGQVVYYGAMIALLAGVEALLAARVADNMYATKTGLQAPRHQANRELIGQGIATFGSALFGGMPSTGAIARTGVNVHAGAQTRLSAVVHAIALAIFVFALAPLVAVIPTAVLAGVLLGTSWRIANPRSVAENLRTTWTNRAAYLTTALGVVAIDLIWGTIIGIVVYLMLKRLTRNRAPQSVAN